MGKVINVFIIGIILLLIPDFLIFAGLKANYFDYYGIGEFYNRIFVDNNNFMLLYIGAPIVGFFFLYSPVARYFGYFYIVVILLSLIVIIDKDSGLQLGEKFFFEKNRTIRYDQKEYVVDIYYQNEKYYYIKRSEHGFIKRFPAELIEKLD
jgi:hypothetical protein